MYIYVACQDDIFSFTHYYIYYIFLCKVMIAQHALQSEMVCRAYIMTFFSCIVLLVINIALVWDDSSSNVCPPFTELQGYTWKGKNVLANSAFLLQFARTAYCYLQSKWNSNATETLGFGLYRSINYINMGLYLRELHMWTGRR